MAEVPNDEAFQHLPWPEPERPSAELSASIVKQCTDGLQPKRGMTAMTRTVLSLLLALGVVLVFGVLSHVQRPEGAMRAALFGAAGWAVVQALVLAAGFLRPPGRRGVATARLALAVGVPVLFLAYLAFAASEQLPLGEFFSAGHGGGALGCGLHALLFGAISGGGTLFLWRRTDPFSPRVSGALAGLAGGLAGAVTIGVTCPSGETWHLWLGHGAAVATLAVAGALLGRRVLSP
jgi:hypothetical protein